MRPREFARALAGSVLMLIVLAPVSADALGYGRFRWGTTIADAQKVEPKLKSRPRSELVQLERGVMKRTLAEKRRAAKAKGPGAYKAWKKLKKPTAKLAVYGYWVDLDGLPARVELDFLAGRLFGAEVGVLYAAKQRSAAEHLLSLISEKYGEPTARRGGADPEDARVSDYDTGDGRLSVMAQPATQAQSGMLRLRYRSLSIGRRASRYIEGLRGRQIGFERAQRARRSAKTDQARQAKKARVLDHL